MLLNPKITDFRNYKVYHVIICIKEIKNVPSALLSYVSAWDFFKTKGEMIEKYEPQANASRTSQVFYFFYKMYHELCALVLMT